MIYDFFLIIIFKYRKQIFIDGMRIYKKKGRKANPKPMEITKSSSK